MSVGILGHPRARGVKISAVSFNGAGVTVAKNALALIDGGAYDCTEWDSDGYTGAIVDGSSIDLDAQEGGLIDNYSGNGILTVPAGCAGVHRIITLASPGGLARGVGTVSAFRASARIVRAIGALVWDLNVPDYWSGPGDAAIDPLENKPHGLADVYLFEGDTVQMRVRGRWNDLAVPTASVDVWCELTMQRLGR